jgi:DNA polymerase III delta subunit
VPKLEPKLVQRELDQGKLWPVYWLYGDERMKSRELVKRIRKQAIGDAPAGLLGMAEETIDGADAEPAAILDAAMSPSLGGGLRFLVIRDAHLIRGAEALAPLLGPAAARDSLASCCVFLSKGLDGRTKFSKLLLEGAAVVPCEDVAEGEREGWIGYLAKRKGLEVSPDWLATLVALDPWTLDIVDQELEKLSLAGGDSAVLLGAGGAAGGAPAFIDAFFARDLRAALERSESFADRPDEALPLLGLLAWNVRQLAVVCAGSGGKLPPMLADRFRRWGRSWRLEEVAALQSRLEALDFGFKQTPLLPLGLWTELVLEFCGRGA